MQNNPGRPVTRNETKKKNPKHIPPDKGSGRRFHTYTLKKIHQIGSGRLQCVFVFVSVSVTPNAHVERSAEICIMYIYFPIWWNSATQIVSTRSILVAGLWSSWRNEMVFLTFADASSFRIPSIFLGYCITHATAKITSNSQLMFCVHHFFLKHILTFSKMDKMHHRIVHLSLRRLIYDQMYLGFHVKPVVQWRRGGS